ncbi:MAG: pyrroline-5-carboxylate reductase [Pseudomonadota bacterium]
MSAPETGNKPLHITFIGAGNMATAMIRGLLAGGCEPATIRAADPLNAALSTIASHGIVTTTDNNAAIANADVVVLAVKPQVAQQVVKGLHTLTPKTLLISIAAGINLSSLQSWTSNEQPIVRCMPNTPALMGAGIAGLFANNACVAEHQVSAAQVLSAAGEIVWVDAETQLDAVTAVSGSGPAYFFLLMEAMIDAGQQRGLSRETATQLTLQTAFGAALMARDSDTTPAQLRQNVTSPGGTTAAALEVMLQRQLPDIVAESISAADRRAAELAEEFGR